MPPPEETTFDEHFGTIIAQAAKAPVDPAALTQNESVCHFESTEALLCFDVELAPGAQHPVWARINSDPAGGLVGGKDSEALPDLKEGMHGCLRGMKVALKNPGFFVLLMIYVEG